MTTSSVADVASRLQNALESNSVQTLLPSDFRVFIDCSRKDSDVPEDILKSSSKYLLLILESGQLNNDSQIVVATAYVSTITSLMKRHPEMTFTHFINFLNKNKTQVSNIFICYAVLQLNDTYWPSEGKCQSIFLREVFQVVKSFICELKSTTFLVFKVFYILLCKIHQIYPNGDGVIASDFSIMLKISLSNWENPLSGVRQTNSLIFGQLLLFNKTLWDAGLSWYFPSKYKLTLKHQLLLEMIFSHIPWHQKAKYFLLTSILQETSISQVFDAFGEDIVEGLLYSLTIPNLVSAGTDLYRTVLIQLSPADWKHWFFKPFTKLITQNELSLALENLFDYWMQLTIKQVPAVYWELITCPPLNMFSYLCLKTVARKECFPDSEWESVDKTKIKQAIEGYSDTIRAKGLGLICVSSKTSLPPSNEEFDLIQQFLRQNVNSDNPALRHSVLNSFTSFIIRIRDSLLYFVKSKLRETSSIQRCFSFFDWLHSFLIGNMKKMCNYQRKITTLELLKIILTYFGERRNVQEKSYVRKSNKNHLSLKAYDCHFSWDYKFESKSIKTVLFNCLRDEDNNIRFSAADILTSFFKMLDSDYNQLEELFKSGLSLSVSPLFYTAESGALIIQVVVTLAHNSSTDELKQIISSGNDSILIFLLNSAEEQFECLQRDLLKAASQGSFLYGTLQALQLLLNDSSSRGCLKLDDSQLKRLLCLIEKVTKHFIEVLSSKSTSCDYAPSFGEMGMAIAHVVDYSSLKDLEVVPTESDDSPGDLQLTPAQQLVLSCVWLNLKECCKLSSCLVGERLSVEDTERCVLLVVNVLRRCRHKGAIESAGLALYHIAKHITSSGTSELIDLLSKLLETFLQSIVDSTAATVSRRSAGLAILVHRLITGDSRAKKPLLHTCVSRLLPIASDPEIREEALVDLPQSQALHFLRTLVLESSLREHMAQYTLDISIVALTNLASPVWTVRNAALQLFGSLVPKLVGQKPHQDERKGSRYLAFEELYIRAQPLVDLMLNQLQEATSSDAMDHHSKIMPILTLLTNVTMGPQCVISKELKSPIDDFLKYFQLLSSSKIYNVRKLSAKGYSLFLTSSALVPTIISKIHSIIDHLNGPHKIKSESELHGHLLSVLELLDRFNEEKVGMKALLEQSDQIRKSISKLCPLLLSAKHSYFVKSLIFDFSSTIKMDFYYQNELNSKCSSTLLGFPNFISKMLNYLFLNSNEETIKELVNTCLFDSTDLDVQLSCLKGLKIITESRKQLEKYDCNDQLKLFTSLQKYVLRIPNTSELFAYSFDAILLILESIIANDSFPTMKSKIHCSKFTSFCTERLFSNEISSVVFNSLLPVTCCVLASGEMTDLKLLTEIANIIRVKSNLDFDQDVRVQAAKSMSLLIPFLKQKIIETSGKLIWEASVAFLQDEVVDVRFQASRFVSKFFYGDKGVCSTFLSLESLFYYSNITQLMTAEDAFECLWDQMLCDSKKKGTSSEISNPFDHGVKGIYVEESVISHLSYCCMLELIKFNRDILFEKAEDKCKRFRDENTCALEFMTCVEVIETTVRNLNTNNA